MTIMTIRRFYYETTDNKEFDNKKDADLHELKINSNIIAFKIFFNPDLTEGRGFQSQGMILVNANRNHEMFIEHYMHNNFGNKIDFVMGVFGSNAITKKWDFEKLDENQSFKQDLNIIGKIEERFVDKVFDDSINE